MALETSQKLKAAYKHCSNHRKEIEVSIRCGCFYCQETFMPAAIEEWCDSEQTAICPHCKIDSVLPGNTCNISAEFLKKMYLFYFDTYYGSDGNLVKVNRKPV